MLVNLTFYLNLSNCKKKISKMSYMTSAALIILFLIMVEPHPICQQTADQHNATISGPTCNTNLTANETLLNEWLSLNDKSEGIDQLRSHKDSSIASILLNLTTTMVILT